MIDRVHFLLFLLPDGGAVTDMHSGDVEIIITIITDTREVKSEPYQAIYVYIQHWAKIF